MSRQLSREWLGDGVALSSGVGSRGGRARHLDSNSAAKGSSAVVVGDLDQAGVGLAADSARAGSAGGDAEGHGEVDVDVGGALADDARTLEEVAHHGLLGDALGAVAVVARDVRGGGQEGAVRELTGAGGVDNSLDWAAAVRGHGQPGAVDGVADLGQGAAGEGHGGGKHGGLDLAGAGGLAEAVGLDLGATEDGGVDLSLLLEVSIYSERGCMIVETEEGRLNAYLGVGASTRDNGALDSQTSTVATSVTSDYCNLAVGSDEGRGGESEEEDLGEHFG